MTLKTFITILNAKKLEPQVIRTQRHLNRSDRAEFLREQAELDWAALPTPVQAITMRAGRANLAA